MPSMFSNAILILTISVPLCLTSSHGNAEEPSRRQPEFQTEDPLVTFSRRWDVNGDRVYTCDEWRLFAATLFQSADANRDKRLEKTEIPLLASLDRIFTGISFTYFDENGDGVIDRAEFINAPNPFFVIYDTDRDCRVTADEQAKGRR